MIALNTIANVATAFNIGKCLRLDTGLKMSTLYWPNWGITLSPKDADARRAAVEGFRVEWEQTTPEHHAAVAAAAKMCGLGDSNARMNAMMAEAIAANLVARNVLEVDVLDLGCGPGGSSVALADALRKSDWTPRSFTFVDPADTVLSAEDNVRKMLVGSTKKDCLCIAHRSLVEDWIVKSKLGGTNVVLLGAALHHMDAPLVLEVLHRWLPDGAIVGIAEWTHPLLKSPDHFRVMVANLDTTIEPGILPRFDETFDASADSTAAALAQESQEEIAAMMAMAGGFWPCHAVACRVAKVPPMFSPYEGHMTRADWVKTFVEHGFTLLSHTSVNKHCPVNSVFLFQRQ